MTRGDKAITGFWETNSVHCDAATTKWDDVLDKKQYKNNLIPVFISLFIIVDDTIETR